MGMVKCYRCSHSGLYFPEDYVKEWGKKYGIGLGNVPVSEVLDTDYHSKIDTTVRGEKMMHSVGVTRAQLDFCIIPEEEYEANKAIIAVNDPDYSQRIDIIRSKQNKKSDKLKQMQNLAAS